MSTEGEILPEAAPTCPQCGAETPPGANFCWLCGAKQVLASSTPAKATARPLPPVLQLLVWLAVVVVAVLGYGVVQARDPGIAVLYLTAVLPTLLIVLVGSAAARWRGQPWSPGKTAAIAATTAATTVASALAVALIAAVVMALMLVAAVIALLTACFAAAGGHA